MKNKKHIFGLVTAILSVGLLFGCNGADENEPDPTEEPSEQQKDNSQ